VQGRLPIKIDPFKIDPFKIDPVVKKLIARIKESSKVWNLLGRLVGNSKFRNKLKKRNDKIKRIIFVCSGNICRSPFAHYRAKQIINGIEICSAGVTADNGGPADSTAIMVSAQLGVDLRNHKTSRFSSYDITSEDLILVKDAYHVNFIERHRPDLLPQTVLLGSFCIDKNFPLMIKDPWSQGSVDFKYCYEQIEDALQGLKIYLEELIN
jgi:protein-tyrosine phosphatase